MPSVKISRDYEKIIDDWLGHIPGLSDIRYRNVYENRWRVDVYTKTYENNSFYPRSKIAKSYFLAIVNGNVEDRTKRNKDEKES